MIDSRQPIVPSRFRLASTIRGRSAPSSTLSSWIAPADHAGGLLAGQPAQGLHQQFQLAAWSAWIRSSAGCGAARLERCRGPLAATPPRPASRCRSGTVSRRTSGGSGRHRSGSWSTTASRGRNKIAQVADDLRVLAVRAEVLEEEDRREVRVLHVLQRRSHLARLRPTSPRRHVPARRSPTIRPAATPSLGDVADQADGPRLVGRLHRDDGVARLNEQFKAVQTVGFRRQ